MSITVIIPAYNAAEFIAEAIESVLAQTVRAAQVIVVDDGSKDDTQEVAERYRKSIIVLRQKNAGVSVARNYGAEKTASEWLLFLDADDRLKKYAIEMLQSRIDESALGVIYGKSANFTAKGKMKKEQGNGTMEGPVPHGARAAFWKAPIATPGAAIIRSAMFKRVGAWNPRFNTTADRDLWCRMGTISEFGFIDEAVIERRVHAANMSSDKNRGRQQAVEVQLSFLEWCAEREVDTTFLETTETEIFERNARRALEERAFKAARWIAEAAEKRGIKSSAIAQAKRIAKMPRIASEVELKVRGLFS